MHSDSPSDELTVPVPVPVDAPSQPAPSALAQVPVSATAQAATARISAPAPTPAPAPALALALALARMNATVVVIGAGQAGLSAAYHLMKSGFVPAPSAFPVAPPSTTAASPSPPTQTPTQTPAQTPAPTPTPTPTPTPPSPLDSVADDAPSSPPTFVVLDANPSAGGAWQHRWNSLRMATVNGIFDLPGLPVPPVNPNEPSNTAVPRYFAEYERTFHLPVLRQVTALDVSRVDNRTTGPLRVTTDHGTWTTRAVINATGTWNNPLRPEYPGAHDFRGRQLHARDYVSASQFAGLRVGIVGGGITAVQLLDEISRVTTTRWYTRSEPVFMDGPFTPETAGIDVVNRVAADAEAGLPARSVVSYTNLIWTPYARAAQARGALDRRPMFQRITPTGVLESDGSATSLDVILWATGFRADLSHLDPLHLHNDLGGITITGTAVADDPRIHLIGFGPSQSTVGANRAGRAAVKEIVRLLHITPTTFRHHLPSDGPDGTEH